MTTMVVGTPARRVDGRLKVTGAATYAAEFFPDGMVHAVVVQSTVAAGRISAIDTEAALAADGVIEVLTHRNAPTLAYGPHKALVDPGDGERLHMLQDDVIRHQGQHIAMVVASTFEQATHAASLVRVTYEETAPNLSFARGLGQPVPPGEGNAENGRVGETTRGDADAALEGAEVRVEGTYVIEREHHNPMEPHATIAAWDGGRLTLWDKTQWVDNARDEIAAVFGMDQGDVRVISPFVGGAFGSALRTWPHVTLAAMAARAVGRPVRLVLTRRQMYGGVGYRPYTHQRVALGAGKDGRLVAVAHDGVAETSNHEHYAENLLSATRLLYSCPNLRTSYGFVPLDVNSPTSMRAPGEASGLFALESAMDELAYAVGIDPVELRRRNEPDHDENADLPFSSRSVLRCYDVAAERFGWARRTPEPGSMRDGRKLIGQGMATATYPVMRAPATARAVLLPDGTALVQSAASDMGTGTYTSMTQVAADALGLPMEMVRFELGDTDLPKAPVHGGSMTMASVGSAVQAACEAVRRQAFEAVGETNLGLAEVMARLGRALEATETSGPGDEKKRFSMHAFGALMAEVEVDPDLLEVRVRRLTGAYAAGRIVNPSTTRSQCIGGMTMGIGMALTEATMVDPVTGRVVNGNLAEYLVPVCADVRDLDVSFVDEDDPHVNPMGVKGVGEIALCGVAAALANAVFHATGKRMRHLPITPDKLVG